eukprot:6491972-Amphidinium_carterae.3
MSQFPGPWKRSSMCHVVLTICECTSLSSLWVPSQTLTLTRVCALDSPRRCPCHMIDVRKRFVCRPSLSGFHSKLHARTLLP